MVRAPAQAACSIWHQACSSVIPVSQGLLSFLVPALCGSLSLTCLTCQVNHGWQAQCGHKSERHDAVSMYCCCVATVLRKLCLVLMQLACCGQLPLLLSYHEQLLVIGHAMVEVLKLCMPTEQCERRAGAEHTRSGRHAAFGRPPFSANSDAQRGAYAGPASGGGPLGSPSVAAATSAGSRTLC